MATLCNKKFPIETANPELALVSLLDSMALKTNLSSYKDHMEGLDPGGII